MLLALSAIGIPVWGKTKADRVSVMSFSIRQIFPGEKTNRWLDRKEPCLEMFREVNPDVACLQRVSPVQMQALMDALPGYDAVFQSKAQGQTRLDKDYGQLILFDRGKFTLVENGVFWMSATPDKAFSMDWGETSPRPAVWARLRVAKSGREFYVFNLFPDPHKAEAQKYGLELAVDRIKEICAPSAPVFVCGDFSLESGSWYLRHMNAWCLSARATAKDTDESGSYHDFRGSAHIQTDHIFYRNAAPSQFMVINERYGGKAFISDHFPIFSVFGISEDTVAGPAEDPFVFEEDTPPASDSLAFSKAEWNWQPLCDGVVYGRAQFPIFGGMQIVSVIKYDRTQVITGVEIARNDKRREATSTQAKRVFAKAAINGAYFDMKTGVPGTFVSINGEEVGKNRPDYPYFRMAGMLRVRGYEMLITPSDSSRVHQDAAGWDYVLTCGPLLLYGGEFIPHENRGTYKVVDPRAMIGYDQNSNDAFLVTVDARFAGQATGVRFDELARLAKFLGMTHALALDGGGSRTLWTFKTECMNYPSDNKRFDHTGQRGVSNIIFIK